MIPLGPPGGPAHHPCWAAAGPDNFQVPVDLGLNVCGNQLTVLGAPNSSSGNICVNK